MSSLTIINTESILRVRVTKPHLSNYHWEEELPAKKSFFCSHKGYNAGWLQSSWLFQHRQTLEEVLEDIRYFHKKDNSLHGSIWLKAQVIIEQVGGKYTNTDHLYFEEFEDAIKAAKDLVKDIPTIEINYE